MAIKRNTKPIKKFRFFKSGLPAIVWDNNNDTALVRFKNGEFVTEDEKIAKILMDKGYPQISMKAQDPPDITLVPQGRSLEEGENIPVLSKDISESIGEARTRSIVDNQPKAPQMVE